MNNRLILNMLYNLLLTFYMLIIISIPKTVEIKKIHFYLVFFIFNSIVYFINVYYLKLYFLSFGNLIFSAPFLYFYFYIILNVGELNFALFKRHLLISTGMLLFAFNYSNEINKLFFNFLIIGYLIYTSYLLFQLLFANYQEIYHLLKSKNQIIHNAIIISFVFYITFIICFLNLNYNHKYFNLFFVFYFLSYNIFYYWSTYISNLKESKILSPAEIIKNNISIENLLPLNNQIKIIDFSFNWIKLPSNIKKGDRKSIICVEPFIEIYISKLDSIHEEPYNAFFNSPELSMADFSNECNIPINHLRLLFKIYSKISFHEFKRMCQIKNSLFLIDNHFLKKDTLDALSKKTGFLSYSSFYVNFKKYTHLLPLEYLKRN